MIKLHLEMLRLSYMQMKSIFGVFLEWSIYLHACKEGSGDGFRREGMVRSWLGLPEPKSAEDLGPCCLLEICPPSILLAL